MSFRLLIANIVCAAAGLVSPAHVKTSNMFGAVVSGKFDFLPTDQ